jgi:hypothetical protein
MKSTLSEIEVSKVAYEILAYLFEHPHSRDTAQGIMEWWLLEQRIKFQMKKVKEALSELASKELVVEYKGRDLLTHYRINKNKSREIKTFLKQEST